MIATDTFSVTAPPVQPVSSVGIDGTPQGQLPGPAVFTVEEAHNALNPLQYLPVAGMIYRQATGEHIPPPLAIAGSVVTAAAFGGPLGVLGVLGAVMLQFVQTLVELGSDRSRPPVPEGMSQTGSEAGVQPVTPGSITTPGGYTTLATVLPDFLGGGSPGRDPGQVAGAYALGSMVGMG